MNIRDEIKSKDRIAIYSVIFGIIYVLFGIAAKREVSVIMVFSYFGFFLFIFILYKTIKFFMIVFDKEDKLYALVDFLYIDKLGKIFISSFIGIVIGFFAAFIAKA